jgi:hypothetical protein
VRQFLYPLEKAVKHHRRSTQKVATVATFVAMLQAPFFMGCRRCRRCRNISVSVRPTHLPNSSIKGEVSAYQADAIALIARISMRQRSSYPKPFKAQIVQECL